MYFLIRRLMRTLRRRAELRVQTPAAAPTAPTEPAAPAPRQPAARPRGTHLCSGFGWRFASAMFDRERLITSTR
jgi:hypothetical protein